MVTPRILVTRVTTMNEKNDFALVPTPPGAIEKAHSGAKRILSGMVEDALELTTKESGNIGSQPHKSRSSRTVVRPVEQITQDCLDRLNKAPLKRHAQRSRYWRQQRTKD